MNVLLKPELRKFVAEKVKAGQFADASDLLNEAVEVLRDQERFTPSHEAYLRRELKRGLDELDRGEYSNFTAETVIARERAKLARQSVKKKPSVRNRTQQKAKR
jgi:antitoxin ParD1/3/4